MPDEVQVGIADLKTAINPTRIITLGLGSCVGVTLYDPAAKIGGLLHIMLPDSRQFSKVDKPAKFADLGIPLLIKMLLQQGAKKTNLQAKMAGGAQMFSIPDKKNVLNIGQRNVEMALKVLKDSGIKLLAQDTGGNKGRTMILQTSNGEVLIRTLGQNYKVI